MYLKINYLKCCLCLLIFALFVLSQTSVCYAQPNHSSIIDSLKNKLNNTESKPEKIKICFTLVEEFMDSDQYYSAQIWLNKIAILLPVQQASINSYFLSTRQAEIFYYNRLIQLGLQESKRSLKIAIALKDSFLLADAYNFTGLFYLNLDSIAQAIPYFKKGMKFIKQPPYPAPYLSLTKPHHLYGNLSEAYTKLQKYDSAIFYANTSLNLAKQINWHRGISVALNNLGHNYLKLNLLDSAIFYFDQSNISSKIGEDFDIELLNYGSLAKTYQLKQHKHQALGFLDSGFKLIKNYPIVNSLHTNLFFEDAIYVYENFNMPSQLIAVLQQRNALLQKQIKSNTKQINIILEASLQNETRVLNLQIEQAKQQNQKSKIRLYYLSALLLLGIIAFVFYRYAIIQKLQKSRLRNKISKDLHDDVGSSLSSLNLYSTVASKVLDSNPSKAKEMLQKISDQSLQVMENISDIVWSMKTVTEDTVNLSTKIKILAADTLTAAEINYQINIDPIADVMVKSIPARRTILMIIKEAINNAVKYSAATNVTIEVKKLNNALFVEIKDDGKGFNTAQKKAASNGLENMQKRALELNGSVEIKTGLGKGTSVTALLPLAALNNVGW